MALSITQILGLRKNLNRSEEGTCKYVRSDSALHLVKFESQLESFRVVYLETMQSSYKEV